MRCDLFLSRYIDIYLSTRRTTMTTASTAPQTIMPDALKASSLKLHVSLDVKNMEESIRFYSALFDMKPTKLRPGYAKFDAQFPAVNLAIQERDHCCLQGLSHMGIRVPIARGSDHHKNASQRRRIQDGGRDGQHLLQRATGQGLGTRTRADFAGRFTFSKAISRRSARTERRDRI